MCCRDLTVQDLRVPVREPVERWASAPQASGDEAEACGTSWEPRPAASRAAFSVASQAQGTVQETVGATDTCSHAKGLAGSPVGSSLVVLAGRF